MKIATRYNDAYNKVCEVVDDTLITDQSQFIPLGQIVRRTLAGEILDVVNWFNRNPFERAEKFDILDAADRLNRQAEEQAQEEQAQAPEPEPTPTPSPDGE